MSVSPARSYKAHFAAAMSATPDQLHMAAHSHHPWPDVTRNAHLAAWDLAARHLDHKWSVILDTVVPEAQGHVARRLHLPDPTTIVFAPNTHELVMRVASCLPERLRILTTDAEFHSAERQFRRWEEAGRAEIERVAAEPFATFPERFAAAMGTHHDLVLFSHVLYNSGYVVPDLDALVAAVPSDDTFVVIDGYHGFMAVPTDLGGLADRVFYVAGGYKYAMAGEGVCFLHAPPGYGSRPVDTGWFATFGTLSEAATGTVSYARDGWRFAGATFDPSGLCRFNAVQGWLDDLGLDVGAIHAHVGGLQGRFLQAIAPDDLDSTPVGELIPGADATDRGHFLTFRTPDAARFQQRLAAAGVVTDHRGDRLRFGFGLYHDPDAIDRLVAIVRAIA